MTQFSVERIINLGNEDAPVKASGVVQFVNSRDLDADLWAHQLGAEIGLPTPMVDKEVENSWREYGDLSIVWLESGTARGFQVPRSDIFHYLKHETTTGEVFIFGHIDIKTFEAIAKLAHEANVDLTKVFIANSDTVTINTRDTGPNSFYFGESYKGSENPQSFESIKFSSKEAFKEYLRDQQKLIDEGLDLPQDDFLLLCDWRVICDSIDFQIVNHPNQVIPGISLAEAKSSSDLYREIIGQLDGKLNRAGNVVTLNNEHYIVLNIPFEDRAIVDRNDLTKNAVKLDDLFIVKLENWKRLFDCELLTAKDFW